MRKFSIAVLVTTRGNPDSFLELVESIWRNTLFPDRVTVACYVDDDDNQSINVLSAMANGVESAKFDLCIGPRPLTLGHAVNHLFDLYRDSHDLFVFIGDEYRFHSRHWDYEFDKAFSQNNDGILLGYIRDQTIVDTGAGELDKVTLPVITRQWGEAVGYYWPDYFPFWWSDTWLDEIAIMLGRKVPIDVDARATSKGLTRRFWNAPFWHKVYQAGFADRVAAATKLWDRMEGVEPGEDAFHRHVNLGALVRQVADYRFSEGFDGVIGELSYSAEEPDPSEIYLEAERNAYTRFQWAFEEGRFPSLALRGEISAAFESASEALQGPLGDLFRGEPLFLLAEKYGCSPKELLLRRNAFVLGVLNNAQWRMTP